MLLLLGGWLKCTHAYLCICMSVCMLWCIKATTKKNWNFCDSKTLNTRKLCRVLKTKQNNTSVWRRSLIKKKKLKVNCAFTSFTFVFYPGTLTFSRRWTILQNTIVGNMFVNYFLKAFPNAPELINLIISDIGLWLKAGINRMKNAYIHTYLIN